VLAKYHVDFAILTRRKELVLIELERPGLRLLRKDGSITADLQHALTQVHSWLQVFSDHRGAALDAFDLKLSDVTKIRGAVIAGRDPKNEAQNRLLRERLCGDIEFYTYDDILSFVKSLLKQIANV
jgi:hypothetical protein